VQYWAGCPQTPNAKWQRFLEVIRACSAQGWRTCIVWTRLPEDESLWQPFEDVGCRVVLEPRPTHRLDIRCIVRTRRLLRAIGCDIFHCHNVHTSPLIGAALARVPVRIWSDLAMSSSYEQGVAPRGLHRWAPSVRLSCSLATRVWAISGPVRQELLELGASAGKIDVMPVPVDVERYARAIPAPIRVELGLSPSDRLIVAVGHAVPLKGWDVLVEAFGRACGAMPDLHLVLVGSVTAPDEAGFAKELRERARRHEISHRVHLLGQRHDIPEILKAADIFAFPSRSDGQGLALTEALAAGLPCVAARVGGIPDLVTHGHNGLLFEREDANGLAAHLKTLLQDGALRAQLSSAAQLEATRFGMEAYVERSLREYAALLQLHGGPRAAHAPTGSI
jgi:glycosyltransferase involved in cell wall biosynthesis